MPTAANATNLISRDNPRERRTAHTSTYCDSVSVRVFSNLNSIDDVLEDAYHAASALKMQNADNERYLLVIRVLIYVLRHSRR